MMDVSVLRSLNTCNEAIDWVEQQPNLYTAWRKIRADWLLWFAARTGMDRKIIVAATCDCAETVLHFVPKSESRPRIAIETARKRVNGKATIIEVQIATYAAYAAAYAADAYAAAYAAAAAAAVAHAAYTVYTAVYAAATYTAAVAAVAAADAYGERKEKNLIKLGTIVRRKITYEMVKEAWRAKGGDAKC